MVIDVIYIYGYFIPTQFKIFQYFYQRRSYKKFFQTQSFFPFLHTVEIQADGHVQEFQPRTEDTD